MKTKDRNPQSYFAIVDSFLKQAELDPQEYNILTSELKRYLSIKFERGDFVHPVITKFCTDWYREFYRLIGFKDPYKKLKDKSNQEALKVLPNIQANSFLDAVKLSVKGNQLDFGAILILNPDLNRIKEEFQEIDNLQLTINDIQELEEEIKKSRTILFLPDNAGEIIFDIPLLKYLNSFLPKYQIFIAAKDSPMLNDVTYKELKELEIDKFGTLVSIGSNCFGLHEEDVSIEFKKILKDVDLIIAKGQAYLEFFTEYNFKNVFNITRIKYPIISKAFDTLEPHQNVVISSKRYYHTGKPYIFGTLHHKIIERSKIRELAEKLKAEGKTIVTVNGSFDILHLGHIRTLEDAKRQGDALIVGLNSDLSIKQYKSPFRPINNQEIRAEFIASLQCVDYVFIFEETVPMPFLEEIKPHVHCNGAEYGENCIEAPTVKKNGGRIHIMPPVDGFSTTEIIKRMEEAKEKENEWKIKQGKTDNCLKNPKKELLDTIKNQKGVLFAKPAIVYRSKYSGRDIIAKNSKFENGYVDERGYVPVEWWIMSITHAENEITKKREGITKIKIGSSFISLNDGAELAEKELFGKYKQLWPLTKILDIGGLPTSTSFSNETEVPPIPTHVHSGTIKEGKIIPPGKLEAYFFPPLDVPPYNKNLGRVITRLGLIPGTTKKQLKQSLEQFGKDDSTYNLCNTYEIKPYEGWIIPAGVVHAPGPWITFEIQLPQDDFNLLGWQLGKRLNSEESKQKKEELQLRGLQDEEELIRQAIDWESSTHPEFKNTFYRSSRVLEQSSWGRRIQIFFDPFYGEAIEIEPGQSFNKKADERPFAGIVWSGRGRINNNQIDVGNEEQKEFLVTPNIEINILNDGKEKLLIYTVFPIGQYQLSSR